MDGNFTACPVLTTQLSLKYKKTSSSQISDNNVFLHYTKGWPTKSQSSPSKRVKMKRMALFSYTLHLYWTSLITMCVKFWGSCKIHRQYIKIVILEKYETSRTKGLIEENGLFNTGRKIHLILQQCLRILIKWSAEE